MTWSLDTLNELNPGLNKLNFNNKKNFDFLYFIFLEMTEWLNKHIFENMKDGFLYVLQTNISTNQKFKLNIQKTQLAENDVNKTLFM